MTQGGPPSEPAGAIGGGAQSGAPDQAGAEGLTALVPELGATAGGVILFDGQCRFCIRIVAWLLRSLGAHDLRVCSTRSPRGTELCRQLGCEPADTFAYLTAKKVATGVDAYRALLALEPRTRLAARFIAATPTPLSTGVYRLVARNRTTLSRLFARADRSLPQDRYLDARSI